MKPEDYKKALELIMRAQAELAAVKDMIARLEKTMAQLREVSP